MIKALFLDRDGVINHMVLYDHGWDSPQKPQDVTLVKGIEKIISWANKNKVPVVVVSNQPGVAKGKMTQEISDAIEARTYELLKERGAVINKAYICPHHPEAVVPELKMICDCRKPKPGLLIRAARELGIDLGKSVMLGDKASDVEAGKTAGCKTILYFHKEDTPGKVTQAYNSKPSVMVKSHADALTEVKKYF